MKNGGELEKVTHKSRNGEHTFTFVVKDKNSIFQLEYDDDLLNKLQTEKKDLMDKINKLNDFKSNYEYYTDELSRAYLYSMSEQEHYMQEYLNTLNDRIALIKKAKKHCN